jgi:hypothetical protein
MSKEFEVVYPVDPIIGRRWSNYHVAEAIGSGGMGTVYRMTHDFLQSVKAIKVLHLSAYVEEQHRFQQEALAASAVDSDKIVRVDDAGEWDDGRRFIVMELIEGRSLYADLEDKKTLPLATALKLLYRLADTLALVHARGIVHRDLKPMNVLLRGTGYEPKICDFGLVSVATAPSDIRIIHTQERMISGTPGYQSPEQLAAYPTDGRTDIYTLGVIGYEALAGIRPHPPLLRYGPFASADFFTAPVPSIAERRPRSLPPVPLIVEEVIARALAKDVARRYTTAIEFRDALGRCLAVLDGDDGVPRNHMLTMVTTAADASAPAPALRTPPGEIDAMIERLRVTERPTVADVTAPRSNAPVAIADAITQCEPAPEPFPREKDVEAIVRIIRRRFRIRSSDDGAALEPRQKAAWTFLRAFAEAAPRGFKGAVSFGVVANLLTDLSSSELELIAGMLKALRAGRAALDDWLAKNWD